MKIKITLLLFILCLTFQSVFGQLEVDGSDEFGRIFNVTYDATIPNKVYAVTLGNHIIVSEDNGKNWQVLYSLIYYGASIKDMKLSSDGKSLTFSAHLPNTEVNAVMVYEISSASIIKTYPLPNQKDLGYLVSYDFYDNDMDVLIVATKFPVGFETEGKTFYTADGGANWEMIYYTNDNDFVFINKVAISPNNPDKIFLTRGNGKLEVDGGLFISDDAGRNFTEKLPGIVLDPIAFDPSNDETIFLGTGISFGGNEENLYKSVDNGNTFDIISIRWTTSTLNNITVIEFNENNPSQIIVLEENEIAISEDGGNTFENTVYPDDNTDSYYYGLNASYNPQNNQEVIISSNYIPLFSSEGGQTVSKIYSPYFTSTGSTAIFKNETNTNLYYGVQKGHIHRDLNSGKETAYNILPLNNFSSGGESQTLVDQIIPNRIYSFSSSFFGSALYVSNDNGATKNQLLSLFKNKFTAQATFPNHTETIFAAFAGYEASETVLKKIDFTDINKVEQIDIKLPTLNFIYGIIIDNTGKITLSIGNEVYSSIDEGETWENNSKGLDELDESDIIFDLKQDPKNNDFLALATSKGIFISEDNGENWVKKTKDLVNKVEFSSETSGAIIASTYNSLYTKFTLYYSVDYGANWETINNEQLLGIQAYSSAFHFEKDTITAYIGSSDLGLLKYIIDLSSLSVLDPINSTSLITIFPNPFQNVLNIKLNNSKVIYASIYSLTGKKVLEFKNKESINVSGLAAGIYSLRIKDNNNTIFFKRIIKQ
ncbi:Por secretion system C-terminal sorting domain-containing protein [Polaribacter sp. KT25b]|uniref:T9SS type A sorting domain-containing protein n=1 Tax=Polaribacter sp. KT25b TaxID=1855336 RepID=UPI00087B2F6A|nr:T9SS type A sorting domain-containing protein [Polaribacter sp. KT25b]SDS00011.1 Por secretion system C-terminal sorting domain-containing protein [Polaribacter sp. KT25b]